MKRFIFSAWLIYLEGVMAFFYKLGTAMNWWEEVPLKGKRQ